jgi:putative nucleotidyltransferase with HDIG domain
LSLFSIIQKLIMQEAPLVLQWRSYVVPILYGGLTGIVLGLWYARLKQNERELLDAYNSTLQGWAKAVAIRDKGTQDHTDRVVLLMEVLAKAMKIPKEDLVFMRWGAMLHDIGKIGVPDAILNKPAPLDEEEMKIMRQHPVRAREMLEPVRFLRRAIEIPCCHHERWNGSGYPQGLKEDQIPLSARIFAVIDVWDALVSDRPYRLAWQMDDATRYIQENAGILFDAQVVHHFLRNIDQIREYYETPTNRP